jgi:hypothetical protein
MANLNPLNPLVICRLPGAQLLAADVYTLLPGQWVNDNVVAFYLDYLVTLAHPGAPCCVLNPGVASLCQTLRGEDLREALENTKLGAACSSFLLPLCDTRDFDTPLSGTHWTLLRWERPTGFALYDSSSSEAGEGSRGGGASPSPSLATARAVAAALAPLLGVPVDSPVAVPPCAQQANGFDCGMHVAATAASLVAQQAGAPLAAPPSPGAMRAHILSIAFQQRSAGAAVEAFWQAFHSQHGRAP